MAFFGLRFGREVTRNTDARLIHGFCFDNFQSNFVTNAKKGFFPPHMFALWLQRRAASRASGETAHG
jgi:hypothetical protein